jgi:hypothetical protein
MTMHAQQILLMHAECSVIISRNAMEQQALCQTNKVHTPGTTAAAKDLP